MPDLIPRFAAQSALGLTLSLAVPLVSPLAAQAATAAPATLTLAAGAQKELIVDAGIDRIAVGDEAVADVLVTRRSKNSTAARLIVTGKSAGSTTLMVWDKGSTTSRSYQLQVLRREARIDGKFASVPAHEQAAQAAAAAQPKDAPAADRSRVDVRSDTVQVEVKIVEFSRSSLKEVGLNLSSYGPNSHGFSFQANPASVLADAFSVALGFDKANKGRGLRLTLNLLEDNGLARVLAEPTLVAMSGQSASFLAGGELPIPVPQGLGTTTIQYKSFGIGLTLTPTVLSDQRIVLKIAPEASDLDYTNALSIDGVAVPSITTRRADTTVELGDGESFLIGGLVSRSTSSNAGKVPLLGDLPIVGNFFKQQTYQRNEKELVILVTPHLVKPIAKGTDLSARLPGTAEQADGNVWRAMFFGAASPDALPGFSR